MAFSYFFRDSDALESTVTHLKERFTENCSVKVWDAGCAYGQEPFSFAMLLHHNIGEENYSKLDLITSDIDISNRFAEFIAQGVYPENQLTRMPKELFLKYFTNFDDKKNFQISEEIRKSITYIRHDLLSLKPLAKNLNAIISKNTTMHFDEPLKTQVFEMFYNSLADDGILTLGQPQDMCPIVDDLFEQIEPRTLIFRKK